MLVGSDLNHLRYARGIGSDYLYGISFQVNIRTSSDGCESSKYPSSVQSNSLRDVYATTRIGWLSTVQMYLCPTTFVIGGKEDLIVEIIGITDWYLNNRLHERN